MARTKITFKPGALERIGRQAVEQFNAKMQPVMDEVFEECSGRPVGEVKPVLARHWTAGGGKPIPEPQLTRWAELISGGQRIVLRNGG
ncbi:hypothetical protein FB565_003022 [Actinoplanes lutulentus]|uniref:Uncharacterized protein n=1 Tax=Actinoplanes lutulentus TaxID=1287878 RepID=A0A327Z2X2_9ACTN|nr:hypothetical protein [Actinoplanes lutulentus]MBB2943309.1 hypothetical protein [Actinoplanes lutulentus]RAK28368.1 hypothetical protein B0I29_120136 [Actinoplanes lutulentus]